MNHGFSSSPFHFLLAGGMTPLLELGFSALCGLLSMKNCQAVLDDAPAIRSLMNSTATPPVRIGVSSCLLGEQVRFDGGHKKDHFLVRELGQHVEWVSVCPELEVGMGIPREAVRLIRLATNDDSHGLRMVGNKSGRDWTEDMLEFAKGRVKQLSRLDLSGYVLKSKSPSCGMERVSVYSAKGMPTKEGRGLFASVLMESLPFLPVEEEGRLNDPRLRENFIERVFAHHRWMLFRLERFTPARLVEFHSRHKFLLLAHSVKHLRKLGRVVAGESRKRLTVEAADEYAGVFFEALSVLPTVKSHVNVLQHIAGFFKDRLDTGDKMELHNSIDGYRRGVLPRLVPQTLILHHLRREKIAYIADQVYLSPNPKELVLKFHA